MDVHDKDKRTTADRDEPTTYGLTVEHRSSAAASLDVTLLPLLCPA
jgi:hypothetical protein